MRYFWGMAAGAVLLISGVMFYFKSARECSFYMLGLAIVLSLWSICAYLEELI